MAFGQSSGPAAGSRLVNELLELLNAAGHTDFRDARGPMGFTQRQAAGKFTVDEAQGFIDELQEAQHRGEIPDAPPAPEKLSPAEQAIREIPDALARRRVAAPTAGSSSSPDRVRRRAGGTGGRFGGVPGGYAVDVHDHEEPL